MYQKKNINFFKLSADTLARPPPPSPGRQLNMNDPYPSGDQTRTRAV